MVPLPIIFSVSLSNGTWAEIDLIEMEEKNWVSPLIVDSLSKTGHIVREGDQVFIEFYKMFGAIKYFDGAWCNIGAMAAPCLILGKTWLEERHAIIDSARKNCTLKPSHLRHTFTFSNALVSFSQRTNLSQRSECQPSKEIICEAGFDSFDDSLFQIDRTTVSDTWDQTLFERSGLSRISLDILIADSSFKNILSATYKDTWNQELFFMSGFDQFDDTLFEVAPILALFKSQLLQEQCDIDMIWSDFYEAHDSRQFDILDMIISEASSTFWFVFVFTLLRHFKIRGGIFSKWGRMMGIEIQDNYKMGPVTPDSKKIRRRRKL